MRRHRRLRRWTDEAVIAGGEKAGIDFAKVVVVLQDLPASGVPSNDEFGPLREQADAIVDLLKASGKVGHTERMIEER